MRQIILDRIKYLDDAIVHYEKQYDNAAKIAAKDKNCGWTESEAIEKFEKRKENFLFEISILENLLSLEKYKKQRGK